MRRIALILCGLLAAAALVATTAAGDGEGGDGDYTVRAYFDNAGFLVEGEEVRIAGAKVGSVAEVDVAREGEAVSEDGSEMPGKAVAVLSIDDPGFQDFRTDASCLIRPQSLLGEKFVECVPTQPRAAGSEPPPALSEIPEGDIGEGELRLPLENNGKQVDLDLVNNITREPEAERLRLILNDLGAGLAARGEDLGEVIRRADPALQQTDKVLAILAKQNRGLAQLAADSDQILTPLARERESLAGFIRNASIAGSAAAERRDDIAEGFRRFPPALRELELTMVELQGFARQAQPVAVNLREAAPGLTGATKQLGPFSRAGIPALTSLGDAADAAGEDLAASDPVIRDLRALGISTTPTARSLRKLLGSLRKTGGIDHLMEFVLNTSGVMNGYDDYGHYLRAAILITNCIDYVTFQISGCGANFSGGQTLAAATSPSPPPTAETLAGPPGAVDPLDGSFDATRKDEDAEEDEAPATEDAPSFDQAQNGTDDLLEFLVGDGR